MKKIYSIIALSLMAALSLTFVACSDDDDKKEPEAPNPEAPNPEEPTNPDSKSSIIGTWRLVEDNDDEIRTITFKADGTGFDTEIEEDETWTDGFTYSISGNTLTVHYLDGYSYTSRFEITNGGNTLMIYEDDGYANVYVRVG